MSFSQFTNDFKHQVMVSIDYLGFVVLGQFYV